MTVEVAIVPVAGQGTRLLPSTKSQPKEMLPVGRKPVVQYVVEELVANGIKQILMVTGPGKASIENHFDINPELIAYLRETGREELLGELEFERRQVEYFYTRQRRQLGLGHAVGCGQSLVGDRPFAVALGDSIIGLHGTSDILSRLTEVYDRTGADAVIALEQVAWEEVDQYGIAMPGGETGNVIEVADLIEKPAVGESTSNLAVAARYVCSPKLFDLLLTTTPGKSDEIQLTDALRSLVQQGGRIYGVRLETDQRRYDVGDFPSYFRAFVDFALADPVYGDQLRRHLKGITG